MGVPESAWLAGFFEGEGTIGVMDWQEAGRPTRKSQMRVVIANCDRSLLEPIKRLYGGWITTTGAPKKNWKRGYRWEISSNKAENFLRVIEPYLIAERNKRRVQLFFEIQKIKGEWKGSPSKEVARAHYRRMFPLIQEIRQLNRKGNAVAVAVDWHTGVPVPFI